MHEELNCPTLHDTPKMQMNIMIYKVFHAGVPEYLTELFYLPFELHRYILRGSRFDLQLVKPKLIR